jgi:hypothetical protein
MRERGLGIGGAYEAMISAVLDWVRDRMGAKLL